MPSPRVRSTHLSIFLLKASVRSPAEAIAQDADTDAHAVRVDGIALGTLHVQRSAARPPRWVALFDGALEPPLSGLLNSQSAAVWVIETSGRLFALTFGYGRHLLEPGSWEERFGLLVCLNALDPRRLKSIDKRTLDAVGRHSHEQASRDAGAEDFGIDVERDLLRAVTGVPLDPGLGHRLSGMDALVCTMPIRPGDLPALLERFLAKYYETGYRDRFQWVDQLSEVRDKSRVRELDEAMLAGLANPDGAVVWMALPEVMDWQRVEGFRFVRRGRVVDRAREPLEDIDLDRFLAAAGTESLTALDALRRWHVEALGSEVDTVVDRWPVYDCLYCEIQEGSQVWVLSGGKWYALAKSYAEELQRVVDTVPACGESMPPWRDRTERAYNESVARADPATWALMDDKLVPMPGAGRGVEFCDLYDKARRLVHVKRYRRSDGMSHLFAQGVASADLFKTEERFRIGVNERLPETHRLADTTVDPRDQEYEVVFAIASGKPGQVRLPLLSMITLKNAVRRLRGQGYRVCLAKIDIVAAPTAPMRADSHPDGGRDEHTS